MTRPPTWIDELAEILADALIADLRANAAPNDATDETRRGCAHE